jgi:hypothetical protein
MCSTLRYCAVIVPLTYINRLSRLMHRASCIIMSIALPLLMRRKRDDKKLTSIVKMLHIIVVHSDVVITGFITGVGTYSAGNSTILGPGQSNKM